MKKKTNVESGGVEVESRQPKPQKERKHGPQKEKTQITVRVDKELMNEAYIQMKEDNSRITDVVERGIYLALKERDHDMSNVTKQVRFMVANATREQQILIKGLMIAMVRPLLDKKVFVPEPEHEKLFGQAYEFLRWVLERETKMPYASAAMEYYSRYGKTAEEIAELGNL